ncbi:MAG: cardiolipin synthase [Desulfobulbus sp.]|nr:MAG: cardiolipin synthase [Desulfobulbus sp.]
MEHVNWIVTSLIFFADLTLRIGLSIRVIMRKRAASVSLAWLVVILMLPLAGAIIYLLFGENRLGENRAKRAAANLQFLTQWSTKLKNPQNVDWEKINPECVPVSRQISAYFNIPALQGNNLQLLAHSDLFFAELLKDISRATSFCYLQFYILESGGATDDVITSVIDAARRGVTCRIMLDSIGSRQFLKSKTPAKLRAAGVEVIEVLPAGLFRYLFVRVDLRNHRKIVLIDSKIAYTGSQNLVDPHFFKQNSGVGQWKDSMVRIQGPIIEVMLAAFLYDWTLETGASIDTLLEKDLFVTPKTTGDAVVQIVPSGPGFRDDAIHDLLLTTIYAAREELILTTPYFVPDNAILSALKSAAGRGVAVTIVVPEKNDSKLVHYASQSMFDELVEAGVRIMFFSKGLLHSKTITVDNDFCLFGSVNLDMRSFWLNFEMTLFIYNKSFTGKLRKLQTEYISDSTPMDYTVYRNRSFGQRLKENVALLVGPLL